MERTNTWNPTSNSKEEKRVNEKKMKEILFLTHLNHYLLKKKKQYLKRGGHKTLRGRTLSP